MTLPIRSRDAHIDGILRHFVWQALDFDLLDSAEFHMERLLGLDPSNPDSKHLMGLILFRQRRYKAAANMTNGVNTHTGCIYIYGQSCLKLKMYTEGITALECTKSVWSKPSKQVPDCSNERSILP